MDFGLDPVAVFSALVLLLEHGVKLLELSEKRSLSREEAAKVLRDLADELARQNDVEFERGGMRVNVKVPAQVTLEVELEVESDESSLEIEISW